MCDFSLKSVAFRSAEVGDKLIVTDFGTGTRGFAGLEDRKVAVCLLPGTEVAFDAPVEVRKVCSLITETRGAQVARFRQINKDSLWMHHDALEIPNGEQILLTYLSLDQRATVLQLPAAPKTEQEAEEQKRLVYIDN